MNFCFTLICSALLVLFAPACNNTSINQQSEKTSTKESSHEEHHSGNPLKLNNGTKWQANAETTAGISNMKKLIDELPANPTQQDYVTLQKNLVAELNMIFQKCTMTGEAHEQLHFFLLPIKDLLNQLSQDTPGKSGEVTAQIRTQLDVYNQYFE